MRGEKNPKTISVINKSRVIKMTLLSSALHWNYIKTLKQTKKLPLRPDFITCRNVSLRWNSASQAAESWPLTTGRRDSASSGLWSRYAKKSKARDGRCSCPIFYSVFDSWKGPSGWTQREYQKGKIKKKSRRFVFTMPTGGRYVKNHTPPASHAQRGVRGRESCSG